MNGRDEDRIDPGHTPVRTVLRIVGPAVFLVGVLFVLVGMVSFFSSFGSFTFGPPRFIWCFFVGLPLMFVGGVISTFAFVGAVVRYQAGETAPVAKDTFNYLARETTDGVETVARAIRHGIVGEEESGLLCPRCNHANDVDAKFCEECGSALSRELACPSCGTVNDGDARFCDKCGLRLSGPR